jgi:hypothetical protein
MKKGNIMSVKTAEQFMDIVSRLLEGETMPKTVKSFPTEPIKQTKVESSMGFEIPSLEATEEYTPNAVWDKRLRKLYSKKGYKSGVPAIHAWARKNNLIKK